MKNAFSLQNKTILVTGASSGIGREIAIQCSKLGAQLILLARNEHRLNDTLSKLAESNHQILTLDINNTEAVDEFAKDSNKIDGIVHSAGIVESQLFSFLKEDSLRSILDTNLISPVVFTQKLLKKKKLNKSSSIVFISSISGPEVTYIGNASYSASKSALTGIAKTMALELASKNIRVNCVLPAMIQTDLLENIASSKEDLEKDMAKYPLGGYGKPEDVAYAVVYLLSNASKWITGTNLKIDGGLTLR